jgi:hypothetical protein
VYDSIQIDILGHCDHIQIAQDPVEERTGERSVSKNLRVQIEPVRTSPTIDIEHIMKFTMKMEQK